MSAPGRLLPFPEPVTRAARPIPRSAQFCPGWGADQGSNPQLVRVQYWPIAEHVSVELSQCSLRVLNRVPTNRPTNEGAKNFGCPVGDPKSLPTSAFEPPRSAGCHRARKRLQAPLLEQPTS